MFLALCDLFPQATIYSPIYNEAGTEGRFASRSIESSALNRLRPSSSNFRALLPFYPRAVESLDLRDHDLILSSSSAWSHGVIAREGQLHLCYCHNPFRYAWDQRDEALAGRDPITAAALSKIFARWRGWDRRVAREVDHYTANGAITRERIARCFGRSSGLVHPPVGVERFSVGSPGESFVVLSELLPHKRIDVIVRACKQLGLPLTVVGDGPDLGRLRSLAGERVEFTGRVSDHDVAKILSSSAALIQCATEEFGIASVEAQAAGRPVLALAEGGALETVVPGVTGEHFALPDLEHLTAALAAFDPARYSSSDCRAQAERFSKTAFAQGLEAELDAMFDGPKAPRERFKARR